MDWTTTPEAVSPGPATNTNHRRWRTWERQQTAANPHPGGCKAVGIAIYPRTRYEYDISWDNVLVGGENPTEWERDEGGHLELEDSRDFSLYKRRLPSLRYEPYAFIKVTQIHECNELKTFALTLSDTEWVEKARKEWMFGTPAISPPFDMPFDKHDITEWRWVETSKRSGGRTIKVPRQPEGGSVPRIGGLEPHYNPGDELEDDEIDIPPDITDQISFRLGDTKDGSVAVFANHRLLGHVSQTESLEVPISALRLNRNISKIKGPVDYFSKARRAEEIESWHETGVEEEPNKLKKLYFSEARGQKERVQ